MDPAGLNGIQHYVVRLKTDAIEEYLEFNPYGYEFLSCEDFDGNLHVQSSVFGSTSCA